MSFKSDLDLEFLKERQKHFRGRAKIKLSNLSFVRDKNTSLELSAKNVSRLVAVFSTQGCLRLDEENYIPACISGQALNSALERSRLQSEQLSAPYDPPFLDLGDYRLICLHGRHRIEAAKLFLGPFDEWWVVDLYDDTLSHGLRTSIRDEYSNALNFCHGDIYRQIRFYQDRGRKFEEGRWFARLNPSMSSDLLRFQKRKDFEDLRYALDSLLQFPGLWPAFKIGCSRRLFNMHQPEEMTTYLNSVHSTWSDILLQDPTLFSALDYKSVSMLETRNPGLDTQDRVFIEHSIDTGSLLPQIIEPSVRARIKHSLAKINIYIPTIGTFLEDTKWLEPCAIIVHKHLAPKTKGSVLRHLYKLFRFPKAIPVECKGGEVRDFGVPNDVGFRVAYRQLYIFAWRYFPELSCVIPKKDKKKPKPQAKAYNDVLSFRFLQFAHALGFDIPSNPHTDPETHMIQKFLQEIRPPEMFGITAALQSNLIREVHELISTRYSNSGYDTHRERNSQSPENVGRCGRPSDSSHRSAKSDFFYGSIYSPESNANPSLSINSNIFKLFFGFESYEISLEETAEEEQRSQNEHFQNQQGAPGFNEARPATSGSSSSSSSSSSEESRTAAATNVAPQNVAPQVPESEGLPQGPESDEPPQVSESEGLPPPFSEDADIAPELPRRRSRSPTRIMLVDYDKRKRVYWRQPDVGRKLQSLSFHQFAIIQRFRAPTGNTEQLQYIDRERVEYLLLAGKTWVIFCEKSSGKAMMRDGSRVLRELTEGRD